MIAFRSIFLFNAQKMMFSINDFCSKRPNPQFPADLVTFSEAILTGKRHFLSSDNSCGHKCISEKVFAERFFLIQLSIASFEKFLNSFT